MNGKDNFLLDTNIVLGFLKGQEPIIGFLQKYPQATMAVSQITRMELLGYPDWGMNENLINPSQLSDFRNKKKGGFDFLH